MKRDRGENGLTLIEAMVAAALMSLIILGAFLLYERGALNWVWTDQETEVADNLRSALDKVATEVRGARASSVEIPDPQNLRFEDSESGVTVWYRFDTRQGELERSTGSVFQPVTTGVITAVYFSRDPVNPATIRLVLKGKGPRTAEVSVQTAVCVRIP
ncbi:PilW family protein [Thermodesulfitimonas sp.]